MFYDTIGAFIKNSTHLQAIDSNIKQNEPYAYVINFNSLPDTIKNLIPHCSTPEEVAVLTEAYTKLYQLDVERKK